MLAVNGMQLKTNVFYPKISELLVVQLLEKLVFRTYV